MRNSVTLYCAILSFGFFAMSIGAREPDSPANPIFMVEAGGHTNVITASLFTADGKSLITVSRDKSIRIWDTRTGEMRKVMRPAVGPGEEGALTAAALSADDKTLVVAVCGADSGTFPIYAINMESEKIDRILKGHEKQVLSIKFSNDGKRFASGAGDGTVRIWNFKTGECERTLSIPKHTNMSVGDVAWSPDGARICGGGTDGTHVWSVETGQEQHHLRDAHTDQRTYVVIHVAWSPGGNTIATLSADRTIRLWNLNGTVRNRYQHEAIYYGAGLEFTRDSKNLLFKNYLLDIATGQVRELNPGKNARNRFSADETMTVAVGGKDVLALYSASGKLLARLGNDLQPPKSVGWSADGTCFGWGWTGDWPRNNEQHDLQSAFNVAALEFADKPKSYQQALTSKGEIKLARAVQPKEGVRAVKGMETTRTFESYYFKPFYCWTFIPGTDLVMTGSNVGQYLFDVRTGERRGVWEDGNRLLAFSPAPDGRYLLSSSADQVLRIWNIRDEQPLLYFFSRGNDWIAWTKQGYYAASPGGEKLVGWYVGNGTGAIGSYYSADRFRKTFYRPDVIKKLLKAGSVETALAAANKELGSVSSRIAIGDARPPKIAFTQPTKSGTVTSEAKFEVKVSANGENQPITSLRLLVDGRPYQGEKSLRTVRGPASGSVKETWTVELPPGMHRLAVVASSSVSQGVSEEIEILVTPASAPTKPPTTNLHLLSIGVNAYPGKMELNCAVPDAKLVDETFRNQTKGLYQVHSTLLLDRQATRSAILQGLDDLQKKTKSGDVAVVFYAGHGDCKRTGQFHILPIDVNVKELAKTGISGEELRGKMARLPCTAVLIMDCCYAGSFDATKKKRALPTEAGDLVRDLVRDDQGLVVMCGASKDEESGEESRLGHGFFTKALTEGLSGKAASSRDGLVYLSGLQAYVDERVRVLSNDEQYPTMGKPTLIRSFPLSSPFASNLPR